MTADLRPAHRLLLPAITAIALIAGGCSGDDSAGPPESTLPEAPADTSAAAATDPPATSADTTAPAPGSSVPSTEPAASAPASTAAPAAGPLPEPSLALLDVGSFDQPIEIAIRPGDATLYVVEQGGRVVAASDDGGEVVLDITDLTDANGEQGFLGMAFHPTEPLAYVHYSDSNGDTVVAEAAVDPATGAMDAATLRVVLTVDQPYANHNGGQLAFGPDGMLYIGLGDGGSRDDPERRALNLGTRLGKILRIDPRASGDQPFTVPADNPFVGTEGADTTIWAYGLRNPWRFSFDSSTGDLWIADVGQGTWEEIDRAPATGGDGAGRGLNFGWSAFEGFAAFNADQPTDSATPPVYVYDHSDGRCSVSGGTVARNSPVADLDGWYVFGDYCTGEIWALDPTSPVDQPRVIDVGSLPDLSSVSAGPGGELYAVSNSGTISRLAAG